MIRGGDSVEERSGAGIDEVRAGYSYVLGANVENLLLRSGAGSVDGIGNGLANVITGNGAGDVLNGQDGRDTLDRGGRNDRIIGGGGIDTSTGGEGNDAFHFKLANHGGDTITDFDNNESNDDRFRIDVSSFGGGLEAGGTLAASQFRTRADNRAQDGDDRFVFDTTDKTLWFDSNRKAAGGLSLIADLQDGADVTSADVWLV